MAYADAYNVALPNAANNVSSGPAEIQQNWRALMQRLDTLATFSASADPITSPVRLLAAAIPDLQIATAKLADNAVTTVKIADSSVTFAKLLPALSAKLLEIVTGAAATPAGILAATSSLTFTQALSGIVPGDFVFLTLDTDLATAPQLFCHYNGHVSAAGVVSITVTNPTTAGRDLTNLSAVVIIAVLRPLT